MQLAIISLTIFFLVLWQDVKAEMDKYLPSTKKNFAKGDSTEVEINEYVRPDWQTIDIDFLSSYYRQDGNNGAVTGGIGTEYLTDFTQKIILKIPMNEKLKLNLDAGYDYYSSASTDNIDNIRSSDSSSDMRVHGNIGLSYDMSDTKSIGFRLGSSVEYDYISVNGGLNFDLLSQDKNTGLHLGMQAFRDKWELIYPIEIRQVSQAPTDKRNSYNGSIGISRVLNKKMQLFIQAEGVYMDGLLSTPFHRVYFQEQNQARIENLPNKRLKLPIGVRLNSSLNEYLVMRLYYRYYWDDWGVKGHTASVELPVKINSFFNIYPYYRYHKQTAADYFQPYKEHSVQDEFYTSDYDLSALSDHSFGLGMSYSPANGIASMKLPFKKRPAFMVKSIDLKYSHYTRSTGLKADIVSLGLSFSL